MRDKLIKGMVTIAAVVLLTGCGNKIPQMTDEQQALVVEYAADVVVRHDKNYSGKLVELSIEQRLPEEEATMEKQMPETESPSVPENIDIEEPVYEVQEQTQIEDIASFLKMDTVKIDYAGYEVDDFYPNESESENFFFAMNATEGNKLLILKFEVENISGAETELDIAQSNVKFKIEVNGEKKNALTTMLLNDLAYYQGTVAPGESVELVLTCEIPDQQAGEISSLALIMKSVDNTATISLN